MVLFKACPRCKGDITLDRDIYGPYMRCLQCGYLRDLPQEKRAVVEVKEEPVRELEAA